jgi:pyruvate/2-oxoglutarate dehydrogenase complex dihydrolipoamide acyltransferase (E2) component
MRNCLEMPVKLKKKKEDQLAKPTAKSDEGVLVGFAALADRVGFESEIQSLAKRWTQWMGETVNDFNYTPPKRCGIPKLQHYQEEKLSLFIENLHSANYENSGEITSFFVRRSVYFAFFGKPKDGGNLGIQVESFGQVRIRQELQEKERQAREQQQQQAQRETEERERNAKEQQEIEERERNAQEECERQAREQQEAEKSERLARQRAREQQEREELESQEREIGGEKIGKDRHEHNESEKNERGRQKNSES